MIPYYTGTLTEDFEHLVIIRLFRDPTCIRFLTSSCIVYVYKSAEIFEFEENPKMLPPHGSQFFGFKLERGEYLKHPLGSKIIYLSGARSGSENNIICGSGFKSTDPN
jgi:hypothetical protein